MDELLKAVGAIVVAGGGVAAIMYGGFKLFAAKWLDAKFGERLAAYKHEQEKELTQLRFKINALLDRATKLHQHEFEVLPQAWALLNDAYGRTNAFVSPMQEYPDLNKMTSAQLDEYAQSCDLNKWERAEIANEQDKTAYYIKHIFWHKLQLVRKTAQECHVYLLKNGIFLKPELRAKFRALDDMIWDALIEREGHEQYGEIPRDMSKGKVLRTDGAALIKELEILVQERLWDTQSTAL